MIRRLAALWPKHATHVVLAFAVAGLFAVSAAHAAPTSTLYLIDDGDFPTSELITVQGGTGTITTSALQGYDAGLAVTNTIKTIGANSMTDGTSPGYQYTLSGAYTGTTYAVPSAVPNAQFYDGTTDGTNNYAVDWNTGIVWKFNGSWANPTQLFTAASGALGIAYDTTNNTLWVSDYSYSDGTMYHYSLTGALLGSFSLNWNSNDTYEGLALDPADNTLWIWNGAAAFEQYSKNGALLSTFVLPSNFAYDTIVGAEFAEATPTPIPSALLLFGPGLAGLAFVRRKFGK
jgi:hypothetical protein